jgi:EmrB/QacA subfamily drug resistance transporter
MAFLDGTVVNLALPALQQAFGADISAVQWVMEAYTLTLASLLLVGGSLGDRYGRGKIYVYGTLIFAAASVGCGFANSAGWLIAIRGVQGLGAALLIPGSLALITATFPESVRGRAIGTWSAFSAMTAAVGPIAGGWLIEHLSWRWIFFLNVPLALAVVALSLKIPETRDDTATGPLDWWAAVLTTAGLSALIYSLIAWPSGTHHSTLVLIALAGTALLAALMFLEQHIASPMIPVDLFRSRNFRGANLVTFFIYAPLSALLFFTPLDLIQIQRYSGPEAGAAFSPFVIVMLVLSRWAGRLVERYGARLPLTVGPLITTVSYALFALAPQDGHYWTSFFPAVLTLSLGMTITVAPLTATVMNSVPESRAGVASGINNAISRLASLIAIALFGALIATIFSGILDHQIASLNLPPAELEHIRANRLQLAAIKSDNQPARIAIAGSFVKAYRLVLWTAAGSVLCGAITGLLLLESKPARETR